jgi:hypothetical protein
MIKAQLLKIWCGILSGSSRFQVKSVFPNGRRYMTLFPDWQISLTNTYQSNLNAQCVLKVPKISTFNLHMLKSEGGIAIFGVSCQ